MHLFSLLGEGIFDQTCDQSLTAISGVARPQDGRPAAVFNPFGHPMPYTYACEATSKSRLPSNLYPFMAGGFFPSYQMGRKAASIMN
jgi:hypothetical protein